MGSGGARRSPPFSPSEPSSHTGVCGRQSWGRQVPKRSGLSWDQLPAGHILAQFEQPL